MPAASSIDARPLFKAMRDSDWAQLSATDLRRLSSIRQSDAQKITLKALDKVLTSMERPDLLSELWDDDFNAVETLPRYVHIPRVMGTTHEPLTITLPSVRGRHRVFSGQQLSYLI